MPARHDTSMNGRPYSLPATGAHRSGTAAGHLLPWPLSPMPIPDLDKYQSVRAGWTS